MPEAEPFVAEVGKAGVRHEGKTYTRFYGKGKPKAGEKWIFLPSREGLLPVEAVDAERLQSLGMADVLRDAMANRPDQFYAALHQMLEQDEEAAHSIRVGLEVAHRRGQPAPDLRVVSRKSPTRLDVGAHFALGCVINISLDGRRIGIREVSASAIKPIEGIVDVPGLDIISPMRQPGDILLRYDTELDTWFGVLDLDPAPYGSGLGPARMMLSAGSAWKHAPHSDNEPIQGSS